MDMQGNNQVLWWYETPLTALQVVNVPLGMSTSGVTVARCANCLYLTYGVISENLCTVEVLGSESAAFMAHDVLRIHAIPVATYCTPYELGGNYGLTGYLVLTRPFVRVRLTEVANVVHDYTRLFVKAWGN